MLSMPRHSDLIATAQAGADVADAQLLDRFVNERDPIAFEMLLHRHRRLVWGVCRRVVRDAGEAEDVFQATFLTLARKASAIRQRGSIAGWLYRVAYRMAKRANRASLKRRALQGVLDEECLDASMPDALAETIWRDVRGVLDEELQKLSEKHRLPILICHLEGCTHKQAARQLGWPIGTVHTRLRQGRERLRRRLAARGLTLSSVGLFAILGNGTAFGSAPKSAVRQVLCACPFKNGNGAATASAVPANVETLVKGALQGMTLNKVKVLVVAFLMLGALGTGTGLLIDRASQAQAPATAAIEPVAAANAAKDAKKKKEKKKIRETDEERQRENERETAEDQLNKARAQLHEQEHKWSDELIKARIELAMEQARLNKAEEHFAIERELYLAKRRQLEQKQLDAEMARLELEVTPPGPEQKNELRRASLVASHLRKALPKLENSFDVLRANHEKVSAELRRNVIASEEQVKLRERLQEAEREQIRRHLHAAINRLEQGPK